MLVYLNYASLHVVQPGCQCKRLYFVARHFDHFFAPSGKEMPQKHPGIRPLHTNRGIICHLHAWCRQTLFTGSFASRFWAAVQKVCTALNKPAIGWCDFHAVAPLVVTSKVCFPANTAVFCTINRKCNGSFAAVIHCSICAGGWG